VPTRRQWFGLATLATGLGMIVLDGTIVGVALPRIISDLGLDITAAQWVNSLYAVLLAALLLSTGKLADRWGRKRLFLTGLIVLVVGSLVASTMSSVRNRRFRPHLSASFTGLIVLVAGSLVAAASGSSSPLIGARAIQAVGAAFIMPSTLST